MSASAPPVDQDGQEEIGALMEQRAQLKGWLARLEECADAPPHILERVREDYRERLRQATERLQPYLEGLRQELAALRAEQESAHERYTSAVDALEETRLRHRVGELEPQTGSEREAQLEGALREAEAASERLAAEVERLAALLAGIESDLALTAPGAPAAVGESSDAAAEEAAEEIARAAAEDDPGYATAAETAEEAAVAASADLAQEAAVAAAPEPLPEEPADEETGDETLPWLELIEARAEEDEDLEPAAEHQEFLNWIAAEVEPSDTGDLPSRGETERDDDLEFLEELDRALAATALTRPVAGVNGGEAARGTTPAVRYCRACGSDNDQRAWYCEICGEELA